MQYYNYLTTPSGKYCQLKDLPNSTYLIMVKFLQSHNYKAFFETLDQFVTQSIPDFQEYNIYDKMYIYIAICMYNVRPSFSVGNTMLGTQQINISLVLNNLENSFLKDADFNYQLKEGITLNFGYPTTFTIQGQSPWIDWFSGIKGYNGIKISKQQADKLKSTISTKSLSFIQQFLKQKFYQQNDIFYGVPMNQMKINVNSQALIVNVLALYKTPLDVFYKLMYECSRHIKISFSQFMARTFVEMSIIRNFAIQENAKYQEQSNSGGIPNIGQMID